MNILFISRDLGQINLACTLAEEGNSVKVYEVEKYWQGKMKRPLIKFIADWKKELDWVGKDGLIVFDYSGFGKLQDELRAKGYSVFGGNEQGEILEDNRQYGQKVFSACGMKTKKSKDFYDIGKMVNFIKKNPRKWVVKQNGHMDKGLNYVGQAEDGSDLVSVLTNYRRNLKSNNLHFDLQEKIEGIEIAAGRFFNGSAWAGPICINIEHKNLFNGDLGPKTHEMGNLMWYDSNEKNKLFQETLGKMEDYLRKINFKGYFDINCILNEDGVYPLEVTARLGQPTVQTQNALHISPWGGFMKAVADGKNYDLKHRKGFAVSAFLGTPPYPYANRSNLNSPMGVNIFLDPKLSQEELDNIHLEEVSVCEKNGAKGYRICGKSGYIAHVASHGKTAKEAREKLYNLINKIIIPKVFYRTDIGLKFVEEDEKKLREWGWM